MKSASFLPIIGLVIGMVYASLRYQKLKPKLDLSTEIKAPASTSGSALLTDAQANGEKLFKLNCAACHKANKALIGPPLNAALDEWGGDKEAMYLWVRNWPAALEAGYPRAIEVVDYDVSAMNLFPTLTDEEIDAIFDYASSVR